MKKTIVNSFILGLIISGAALYLAFRNVPAAELFDYLSRINYFWIIPSIAAGLLGFVFRVMRWQIILASSHKVSFMQAFHPLMIGFMINCILPGRVGELARPVILKKKTNIPFTTGLATVITERVFDMGLLILLFALLLAFVPIDPQFDMAYGNYHLNSRTLTTLGKGMANLGLILILGMTLVSFGKTRAIISHIIRLVPKLFFFADRNFRIKLADKLVEPLLKMLANVAAGFTLVRSLKKMLLCCTLSLLIWAVSFFSIYLMALGAPGIDLTFLEISAVMVIICFFIALPGVPGFWGIWEAGGIFAMTLFGVSTQDAAGFTLANHVVQIIPVIVVGMVSAILIGVNILHVSYEKKPA